MSMKIPARTLGTTDQKVSELGLGTWSMGGQWGERDDAESIRTIHEAIDSGITLIDTAEGYGQGHAERIVAQAFKDKSRDGVLIATKTPPAAGPWPPSPYCRWQDRYSAAYLRQNVQERLKNLETDCIDLLQLHTWTSAWNDDPQPLLVLRQLRDEGKIKLIGVSTPEQDQSCVIDLMRSGLVDVVQVIFNLFDQEAAARILPVAAETGTGVIVRVALDEGSLGGMWSADQQFGEEDIRGSFFAGDRLARTVQRVEAIREDIETFGLADDYSVAEASIRFVLDRPEVSSVIVGMRTPKRIRQNAMITQKPPLPDSLSVQLRRHNWLRGVWYSGK